jgi:DNA-binding GntR family transcriptional regulator
MTNPNVPHRQLKDIAAQALRNMIAQGDLAPGEWLRQERLAEKLNVSYTPIREALKQLEAEGLVEHIPYRGVRVAAFAVEDVLDIYTMRAQLESMAAGAAALHMAPATLDELEMLHQQMVDLPGDGNLQQVRELNRRFHQLIIEASGRTYLIRTLAMIWSWFPAMLWNQFPQTATQASAEREQSDNAEHAAILAALRQGDGAAAEQAMQRHIDNARQSLITFLQAQR